MAKYVAVEGCTLRFDNNMQSGSIQISSPASTKVKAGGKGVYFGPLTIVVSGFTGATVDVSGSGTGTGTLNPSGQKVSSESKKAVLEGDSVTFNVNGQKKTSSGTAPVSESVTVKITAAGQTIVQAT